MKNSKIFWGIFFILAAIYVVISKIGILPDIGVFSVVLAVFMLWMFIEGVRNVNFFGILFSIAFVCIIYDEQLGITSLTPWTVLGAALLGSIGLTMIFKDRKKKWKIDGEWEMKKGLYGFGEEQCGGEHVRCDNNFGSAIRYINSDNFCNAHLENNFGTLTVYFDNAIIQGSAAYVEVENNFGETNLYIPKEWDVQNCLERAFGSVSEKGRPERTSKSVLYIKGEANFGVINIYYV